MDISKIQQNESVSFRVKIEIQSSQQISGHFIVDMLSRKYTDF